MAEAYIIDAVRTPVGKRGGGLSQVHPADLGAFPLLQLMERTGVDPAAVEDVVFGCLDTIGPAGGRHRPHLLAGCRPARGGAGHHHRPPVRLVAAGRALRRPGRDERHAGPDRRRWRAEHVHDPHLVGHDRDRGHGHPRDLQRFEGVERPLRRPGDQPVPAAPTSSPRSGASPARTWRCSPSRAIAGRPRPPTRAASSARSPPSTGSTADEGFRRETSLEKMATLKHPPPRRSHHRGGVQPDQRRRRGHAHRQRAGREGPRPHPAGPHPPPQRARRRPGVHAVGADPGHRVRPRPGRA